MSLSRLLCAIFGFVLLTMYVSSSLHAYDNSDKTKFRNNLLRSRDALLKQRSNLERQRKTIDFYLADVDRSIRDIDYALRGIQ